MSARLHLISIWLTELAVRVAPQMTSEQVEVLARDFAKGFADLPEWVFDDITRELAAREFDRFPTYKALRKFLSEQADALRQKSAPPLPGPDDGSLSREDRIWLSNWQNHRAGGFKYLEGRGDFTERMTITLSLMRSLGRMALFRHICRTDLEAAAIAVRKHWEVEPPRPREARTPEDSQRVAEAVRHAIAAMRPKPPPRSAQSAPQTIEEVGPFIQSIEDQFERQHGRKLGALAPERLQAERAANPTVLKTQTILEAKQVNAGAGLPEDVWVPSWEREAC